jgi:protein bicaudal D
MNDDALGSDSEGEDNLIAQTNNQISSSNSSEKQVDLFSEIHLNQMKKLEKQVEGMESERTGLTKSLKEIQDQVERSKGQVSTLQAALATIVCHIEALNTLKDETSTKISSEEVSKSISAYQGWFTVSSKEIGELKAALEAIEKADSSLIPDAVSALKTEMRNVKEKLLSCEVKMEELGFEMKNMDESAADAHRTLDATQTELNMVSEELANLYYKVCNVQGVTPQRVMLDHMDKGK